jgi:hypothetical protein
VFDTAGILIEEKKEMPLAKSKIFGAAAEDGRELLTLLQKEKRTNLDKLLEHATP